jgi:hypothetical protein
VLVSEFGYSSFDNVSISEYSNRILITSISIHILSDIDDIIRIRSESE